MRFLENERLRYAIRKYSVGVASVLLGVFASFGSLTSVWADEAGTVDLTYVSVKESDLTARELTQIHHAPISELTVEGEDTVILVYRPETGKTLPVTGEYSTLLPFLASLGGAGLLLLVLKGKTKKVAGLFVLTVTVGTGTAYALEALSPLQVVQHRLTVGQSYQDEKLAGYTYVGYIKDEDVNADSPLYQYLKGTMEQSPETSLTSESHSQTLPLTEKPEAEVPKTFPSVSLPDAVLPDDYVPRDYPTVDLPAADVDTDSSTIISVVPKDYPTLEKPVLEFEEKVSEVTPLVPEKPSAELTEEVTLEREVLAFETQYVDDADLLQGEEVIRQAGQAGELVRTYQVTRLEGIEVSKKLLDSKRTDPVPQIVARGTKVEQQVPDTAPVVADLPTAELTKETVVQLEEIPYVTEYIEDSQLAVGSQEVRQVGQNGYRETHILLTRLEGVEVSRDIIDTREVTPRPQLIARGPVAVETAVSENPPMVDLPEEFVEEFVPTDHPTVEQPDYDLIETAVSDVPPVVELPDLLIEEFVPSDYPIVEQPDYDLVETAVSDVPPVVEKQDVDLVTSRETVTVASYSTEYIDDATMWSDETRLEQAGQNQTETRETIVAQLDGQVLSTRTEVISSTPLVTERIRRGTKTFELRERKEREAIPFARRTENDPERYLDEGPLVTQTGVDGIQEVTIIEKLDKTGRVIESRQSEPVVIKPALDQVTTVGTKERDIELSDKKLEFKNVDSAFLYRLDDQNHLVRVLNLEEQPTDVSKYQIKVDLTDAKSTWLDVKDIRLVGDDYLVTAKLPELIQFNASGKAEDNYTIKVAKRQADSNAYTSFKSLVTAMQANPAGNFVIGSDLTASEMDLALGKTNYMGDKVFTGTLKSAQGKNYAIYDLAASLLQDAQGATIENIHLADVNVKVGEVYYGGSLAHKVENTTINHVTANGSISGNREIGGLVGWLAENSRITNSSFTGRVMSSHSAGGLVGSVTQNSRVDSSFADVTILSSLNDGDRLGGLVSQLGQDSSITNSFAKGVVTNYGDSAGRVGGLVGAVYGRPTTIGDPTAQDQGSITNSLSLVKVTNGENFIGRLSDLEAKEKTLTDNFLVMDQAQGNHVEHDSLTMISQAEAEQKVAVIKAKASHDLSQTNNAKTTDYTNVAGYKASHAKAYRNLEKLQPFYDRVTLVKEANKLATSDDLVTKTVQSVTPYTRTGQLVTDFYSQKGDITTLVIRYTDDSTEKVALTSPTVFKQTGVLDFDITEKGIAYHPYQFVMDNTALVTELVNLAKGKTYNYQLFNPTDLTSLQASDRDQRVWKLYLEDSYAKVQKELSTLVTGLLSHTAAGNYMTGTLKTHIKTHLSENINSLLVGLSYLDRWYDFSKVRNQLLFGLERYDNDQDSLEMVMEVGRESVFKLASNVTHLTYDQLLSKYTGSTGNILDFVTLAYTDFKGNETSIDEWIKAQSSAYIVQRDSKAIADRKGQIFEMMKLRDFQNHLIPLLTIKDNQVYVIFTTNSVVMGIFDAYLHEKTKSHPAYNERMTEIKGMIDKAADDMQRYFDTLYRLLNKQSVDRLKETYIHVFDAVHNAPNGLASPYYWSKEAGPGAFSSVKSLIGPVGRYNRYDGVAAYAPSLWTAEMVYFVNAALLTPYGLSVLTHEHMHNLDGKIILGGYGRRYGHGPESFARGLFQTPSDIDGLGFNWIFDTSGQYLHYNPSAEQFQTMTDMERYMRRVFDIMYTLDLAEADAMFRQGKSYILNNYNHLSLKSVWDKSNKEDVVQDIYNAPDFDINWKLETVDDLIDHGIVSGHIIQRNYGLNNYYSVKVTDANYGVNENPDGVSGGYTFRRIAMELMAEKGYYGGLIPYASNQYGEEYLLKHGTFASDSYIIGRLFENDEYHNLKDFRKAMFKRRRENTDYLKPFTIFYQNNPNYRVNSYSDIVNLMDKEMAAGRRHNLEYVKRVIFTQMLRNSKYGQESIYTQPVKGDL